MCVCMCVCVCVCVVVVVVVVVVVDDDDVCFEVYLGCGLFICACAYVDLAE